MSGDSRVHAVARVSGPLWLAGLAAGASLHLAPEPSSPADRVVVRGLMLLFAAAMLASGGVYARSSRRARTVGVVAHVVSLLPLAALATVLAFEGGSVGVALAVALVAPGFASAVRAAVDYVRRDERRWTWLDAVALLWSLPGFVALLVLFGDGISPDLALVGLTLLFAAPPMAMVGSHRAHHGRVDVDGRLRVASIDLAGTLVLASVLLVPGVFGFVAAPAYDWVRPFTKAVLVVGGPVFPAAAVGVLLSRRDGMNAVLSYGGTFLLLVAQVLLALHPPNELRSLLAAGVFVGVATLLGGTDLAATRRPELRTRGVVTLAPLSGVALPVTVLAAGFPLVTFDWAILSMDVVVVYLGVTAGRRCLWGDAAGAGPAGVGPSPREDDPGTDVAERTAGDTAPPAPDPSGGTEPRDTGTPSVEPLAVPDTVPGAPDLTLTYDDIDMQERIGAGGNADVYRGTVTVDGTTHDLALKEPRLEGTLHTETVERFVREAETWEKLDDHEHVVDVVDWGREPLPWIATEYMDGGSLAERVGRVDLPEAVWIATEVSDALVHAHRRGVSHLDLKPGNVLFREVPGEAWAVPKVADWGLAKLLLDHSKSIEGVTPQYAAPEQLDEAGDATGHATDVYQLGAVCYELFVGEPPFTGSAVQVVKQVADEPVTPPTDADPSLPDAVDDVLLPALAKDPADRYEGVVYLRDALRDLQGEL